MESSNMSQMLNSDKCEQLSTIGLVLNIGPSKAGSRVMKALQSARRFYSIQNLFEVRVASSITSVIMIRNDGSKNSWMWGTGGLSLERGSKEVFWLNNHHKKSPPEHSECCREAGVRWWWSRVTWARIRGNWNMRLGQATRSPCQGEWEGGRNRL